MFTGQVNNVHVGDKIRVQTKQNDDWYFAKERTRINTYEGTVVKSTNLDPPDTFNLLTGNPNYPISTIALHNVVNVEVLGRSKFVPSVPTTKKIIVETEKGTRHVLSLFTSGLIQCDCKGFQYRRKCSHLQTALQWLKETHGTRWVPAIFS